MITYRTAELADEASLRRWLSFALKGIEASEKKRMQMHALGTKERVLEVLAWIGAIG